MKTYDERGKDVADKMNYIRVRLRKRRRIAGSCLCLAVVILAVVLFAPYDTDMPDVSMYAGSDYYDLIQTINELNYVPPEYTNNFEALMDNLPSFSLKLGAMAPMDINTSGALYDADEEYVEVTDNQVQGVTEADIIKRSDKYIYYLSGDYLNIYSIEGEDSKFVGGKTVVEFTFPENYQQTGWGWSSDNVEMYLSADCTTVTVVLDFYERESLGSCVLIVNLDVTDPADIKTLDYVYFPGDIISTRLVDGDILLTYNYSISASKVDFDDETTFVPSYGKPGDMKCIPAEDIICPEHATAARYTVVCRLDSGSLAVEGAAALLSYSQEIYVSTENIYTTYSFTERIADTEEGYLFRAMTSITGIAYGGDQFAKLGTITLEGSVKDQYSMDEHEGILRVVTTTSDTGIREDQNVNLYCVELSDWSVAAAVIAFAPEGEEATSVRFDGDYAYVCTAEIITLTDPVYFFDLSDLNDITWTDTGTIDGYSTSLINMGEGFLLGIGYGDSLQMKVEVYEQTEEGVVSVCAWEADALFSEVYKSYLINREDNLVGFGIWDYRGCQYVLLQFDGYEFQQIARVNLDDGAYLDYVRACLIDGYLYILAPNQSGIIVEKV